MRTRRISSARNSLRRGYVARGGPSLSLVLAFEAPKAQLESAIAAVVTSCVRANIDLVIACNASRRVLDSMCRRYSSARFSAVVGTPGLRELRVIGMRDAVGEIIVLVDDTATAATTARAGSLILAALEQMAAPQAAEGRTIPWGSLLSRLMGGVSSTTVSAPGSDVPETGTPETPASQAAGD